MSEIVKNNNLDKAISVLRNSLENYDRNMDKLLELYNKIEYATVEISTTDDKESILTAYDKNDKELFKSAYQFLSTFVLNTNLWIWAWSNPRIYKNGSYISRKLLLYGLDLPTEFSYLKLVLLTSRFEITELIQKELFYALASYLTKIKTIFTFRLKINDDKYIYYPTHKLTKDKTSIELAVFLPEIK